MVADFCRRVTSRVDVEAARRAAAALGTASGLSDHATAELTLICSELATNLLDHGYDGIVSVTAFTAGQRTAVRIETEDRGPGIADLDLAMTEGYTTRGSLGQGLPLVRRLADEFEISSTAEGTRVVATKWR